MFYPEVYIEKNKYPSIWKDKYKISSYEADVKSRASFQSLCNFLQESAWNHAEALELGFSHLIENNQMWVLSRLLIKVYTFPRWGDTICIETWPKGMNGIFALRDFHILNENDKIVVAASSAWIVINLINRRPQRLDSIRGEMPLLPEKHALKEKLKKISSPAPALDKPFFSVRYSDLDVNKHVNSVKYIEWILDSYPFDMRKNYDINTFEINFLAEVFYGDEISIHSERISDSELSFLNSVVRNSTPPLPLFYVIAE